MMAELQVKSVGASAEQAGFQGGVVNLVLKSGSNTFKGSARYYGLVSGSLRQQHPGRDLSGATSSTTTTTTSRSADRSRRIESGFSSSTKTSDGCKHLSAFLPNWHSPYESGGRTSRSTRICRTLMMCRCRTTTVGTGGRMASAGRPGPRPAASRLARTRSSSRDGRTPLARPRCSRWRAAAYTCVRRTPPVSGDLNTPGHVDLGDGDHERELGVPQHERLPEQDERERQGFAHGQRLLEGDPRIQVRRPDRARGTRRSPAARTPAGQSSTTSTSSLTTSSYRSPTRAARASRRPASSCRTTGQRTIA